MKRTAFSLVELSIVLVILGLLVGGILAGQSLIRASELRSVSADLVKYQTAIMAFRDKYFALAGDMPNATSFWGDQATGTQSCPSAATPDGTPGTCNGSGNGVISNAAESARLWQHLSLAGMIEGQYSGVYTYPAAPGTNIPAGKIGGTGFIVDYWDVGAYLNGGGNVLMVGAVRPGAIWQVSGAAFTTQDAWNIDKKLDDGIANYGKLRGLGQYDGTSCTGTYYLGNPGTDYLMGASGLNCYLHYYL